MNTTNFDWRTIAIVLLVLFFIVSPLIRLISALLFTPPINVIAAAAGGFWLIKAGLAPWRGGRSPISTQKVTYWRGQRIVSKQSPARRVRSAGNVQFIGSAWYLALGAGSIYAAAIALARLTNLV